MKNEIQTLEPTQHRVTQDDMVLQYLYETGSITVWECMREIGATRLSAIIYRLRHQRNITIDNVREKGLNRYGYPVSWVRYTLRPTQEPMQFDTCKRA